MLIFCDFIQVYVFTTNHHLKECACTYYRLGTATFNKESHKSMLVIFGECSLHVFLFLVNT